MVIWLPCGGRFFKFNMEFGGLFYRSAPFSHLYILRDRLAHINLFSAFTIHLKQTKILKQDVIENDTISCYTYKTYY